MLTAYNDDLQSYVEKPSKQAKQSIITEIKEHALSNGINFNRLFPYGTKRYKVLDTIVYLLSVGGICTIASNTLAEKVGASLSVVYESVKNLKQIGLFLVEKLADGKNKYVFVYKNHADFREILANVFYVESEPSGAYNGSHIGEQTREQTREQASAESLDMHGVEGDKSSPIYNSYNISSSIQEKDNKTAIQESIENEVTKEPAKATEYLVNPYQSRLYEKIMSDELLHTDIKRHAAVIALRAGSNLDESLYSKAMTAVRKLDKHITLGGEVGSVPALFNKLYTNRVKYSCYYRQKAEKEAQARQPRDTSFYYDWLNDEQEAEKEARASGKRSD